MVKPKKYIPCESNIISKNIESENSSECIFETYVSFDKDDNVKMIEVKSIGGASGTFLYARQ